jgi:ABC-2 type transport system permease protein
MLLPLLALLATGQVVNRARDDGTLELLFSHPVERSAFFLGISAVRACILIVPLVLLMLVMGVLGSVAFGQDIPWFFVGRSIAKSSALLLAYVGLGLWISTSVRSPARATLWLLFAWAAGVALLDFALVSLMLQWRLNPQTVFLLASLNPVQAARMALLSGATTELSVLGPVGFFLSNRVGQDPLFALGTLWPCIAGIAAWAMALGSFRRRDIV